MRAVLLVTLVACSTPASKKLPGGSITPHLDGNPANAACGDDIAYDGDATPDVRYRYAYDALGRVSHATGTYAVGSADSVDYTWDHLDHMSHMVQTRAWYDTYYEIVENYDALGDLVDYSWHETATGYDEMVSYAYAQFDANGNPARQVTSQTGQPDVGFSLDYDALGRVAHVVQDGGSTTTYTYDDAGTRTETIDTDGGAFTGLIVYDDQSREQSESWGGSDPTAIASATQYDWNDGQLLGVTFQQGSDNSPASLVTVEADTLVYGCASTRSTHVPSSRRRDARTSR